MKLAIDVGGCRKMKQLQQRVLNIIMDDFANENNKNRADVLVRNLQQLYRGHFFLYQIKVGMHVH